MMASETKGSGRVRIINAIFAPSAKYIEATLALLCFMLGLWIINPFHTGFSPGSNYVVMLSLFPEYVWGMIFLTISVLQALFIRHGIVTPLICRHRKAILFVQFCIWITMATSFLLASQSTAVPTYTTMALLTAYAMIRVGHNE